MLTLPATVFGVLLRRDRRAAGLTQAELAARAGMSVDTISVLERGLTRAPHKGTLDLLAEALRLTPAERAQWESATWGTRLPGSASPPTSRYHASKGTLSLEGFPCAEAVSGIPGAPGDASEQPERLPPALAYQPLIVRRQLPTPATPLIGREQEVRAICALLQRSEVRLLTLTGSAGVGKTRLALQVAADLAEAFESVHFVSLAALGEPGLVLPAILQALGVRESGSVPVLTHLVAALHEQRTLLVLDNFEQVVAAAPDLAALLEACPSVKVLVTSREVLHLRAEQQFVAHPLPVPGQPQRGPVHALQPPGVAQHTESIELEALEENPAVHLFLQRARAAQPDFHLTMSNAATIADICRRLEGIPLAIELAAPRLKLLSPQSLLARLMSSLHFLTQGARDLPERQRTMRATISWSYHLLTPADRTLFRRLAVFAGGWTLDAARQVLSNCGLRIADCGIKSNRATQQSAIREGGLIEGLGSLLDKSLLSREYDSSGEPRFRMLYVLREFGLEQLAVEGEETTTREAHATYYLDLAEETNGRLQGIEPNGWRERLEQEHDNLRGALNWWLEHAEMANDSEAAEHALRLWWSWSQCAFNQSCYRDGYANMERIMAVWTRVKLAPAVQVKALLHSATLLRSLDEVERAESLVQEALALARETGDLPGIDLALLRLGEVARRQDRK
jgi:predicted ATPase/transcriptional regulator with XRE-family HTH domain